MIIDAFTFFNELDVLEIRLTELHARVDRFVLVEATRTHSGAPKPLHFAEHRARFQPFLDKIVHVVVEDLPDDPNPWVLEHFQRNAITRGLDGLGASDMVIVADVDEIPRASAVARIAGREHQLYGLRMPLCCLKANYVNVAGEPRSVWALAITAGLLARNPPQRVRDSRLSLSRQEETPAHTLLLEDAGWHLSFLGDEAHVAAKIRAYAHQEFNTPERLAALDPAAVMAEGRDLLGRPGFAWKAVALDDYFPEALRASPDLAARHAIPGAAGRFPGTAAFRPS